MTLRTPHKHSIWLCPETTVAQTLQSEIAALTEFSGTPAFDPHVTVLGDLAGRPEDLVSVCRAAFASTGPVTARVTDVARTDSFFMALFLDLRLTPDITLARNEIADSLGVAPTAFRPHLSLAYGLGPQSLDADAYATLVRKHVGTSIRLDQVAVVASSRDLPIEAWHVIDGHALR